MVSQSPCYDGETTSTSQSVQDTPQATLSPRRDPPNIQPVIPDGLPLIPDGLPLIQERLEYQDLSDAVQNILMASWRKGTTKQ